MNKEQQDIILDVYREHCLEQSKYLTHGGTIQEFIKKIKTDDKFSEKWELKIEERELSLEERIQFYYKRDCSNGKSIPDKILKEELKSERTVKMLDKLNIPTKIITVSYKDETIESYEQ